ncbi:MAG: serine hydrolase [Eubacteriales bacterium]|nr:serine hydrolase [Eubacteriales bacterium]
MNKHFKFIFLAAAVCLLLTGCKSREYDHKYAFPDEQLITTSTDDIFVHGFAHDLCVAEGDSDLNIDDVNAKAFGLFSIDDNAVLSQHNIFEKIYPASTTKILTCLLALERGNLDDVITVPKDSEISVSGSSMAGLKTGDQLTLKNLLYGMMVPSGNDAAVAIATYISGDVASFAELMNQRAAELGATHSHFVNPHGLPDEEHYTTVYDMYLIFNECLKHDEFIEFASTPQYSCQVTNPSDAQNPERIVSWTCGNAFLSGKFSFAEGMQVLAGKTGHTNAAGFCLVLGETDGQGKKYISIIMNSPVYEQMYASMRNLAAKSQN